MYDLVTFKCGSFAHSVALSTIDSRLISLLKARIPRDALNIIQRVFLSSHAARLKLIACADLVSAIDAMLNAVEGEGDKLCYVYGFHIKSGPLASSGSGAVSGIRMPGDESHYFSLTGGAGICELQKWGIDETGTGYLVETMDCREIQSLLSENTGEIIIKKRKVKLTLPSLLHDLKSRLTTLDCKELSLSYKETPRQP